MTRIDEKTGEEIGTFQEVIEAIDELEVDPDRHLAMQLDRSLRDAIIATQTSGRKAEVSVKVKVLAGPDRRVTFAADVNAKLPRPPVSSATLYADSAGNVHRSDPAQLRMFPNNPITPTKDE